MSEEIEALKRGRDELAARCERLQEKLEHFLFLEDGMDESTKPEVVAAARSIISETPAASLARIRAEAIEGVAEIINRRLEEDDEHPVVMLRGESERIRQSAAGGE